MRATRFRLRFVPGVSLPAATYGSSTYGGPITYGQRGSDPVSSFRYRVVPLPAGYPTTPAWIIRVDDIEPPLRAQILSDEGPLDLSAVATASLVLTPVDGAGAPVTLPMTVEGNGVLSHTWTTTDGVAAGDHRVALVMTMTSSRRFTLPTDDGLVLTVVGVPGA